MSKRDQNYLAFSQVAELMIPEEDEQIVLDLIPEGGWRLNILFFCMQAAYPKFDFAACAQNGFSPSQLGVFFGHYLSALSKCDSISELLNEKVSRIDSEYERILGLKDECLAGCSPIGAMRVRFLFRRVHLSVISARFIQAAVSELAERAKKAEKRILEFITAATIKTDRESQEFLDGFRRARSTETLTDEGKIVAQYGKDQKALDMRMALLVIAPRLERYVKSVPELHELLANRLGISSMSRDPNSLEWDQDFKTLEWVCRSSNLRFRKPGRPRKV